MGFWELVDDVQKWFEKGLENYWLYMAALITAIVAIGLLVGGGLYLFIKNKNEINAPVDQDKLFIEQNAMQYCMEKGFNGWQFKNNTVKQFECIIVPNQTQSIEKYLNMT